MEHLLSPSLPRVGSGVATGAKAGCAGMLPFLMEGLQAPGLRTAACLFAADMRLSSGAAPAPMVLRTTLERRPARAAPRLFEPCQAEWRRILERRREREARVGSPAVSVPIQGSAL